MVSSFFRFFAKPAKEVLVNTAYTLAATGVGTVTYHMGEHVIEKASTIYHNTPRLFPHALQDSFQFPEDNMPELDQTKTGNRS